MPRRARHVELEEIGVESPKFIELEIAREPDAQDVRAVREAIYAYNRSKAGEQQYEPLTIFLRDNRGPVFFSSPAEKSTEHHDG